MRIRETIDNSSTASAESPPEDVIVLVDSAGVALGVQHAFSAKVRAVRPLGRPSGCAQCGPVEITAPTGRVPVIGPELEIGIPPGPRALAPETGFVAPTLSNRCHVDVESASGRYTAVCP